MANLYLPTKEQQQAALQLVKYYAQCMNRNDLHTKLELVDKYYHMQEMTDESKKSEDEITERYTKNSIGLVRNHVQTEVPFMQKIFLSDATIFTAVNTSTKQDDISSQLTNKVKKDSEQFSWTTELIHLHTDLAKHDLGAIEVDWSSKRYKTLSATTTGELETKAATFEGTALRRIELYNVLFDMAVTPNEVASKGEFSGKIERMSQVTLFAMLKGVASDVKVLSAEQEAEMWKSSLEAGEGDLKHYTPCITPNPEKTSSETNWMTHGGSAKPTTTSKLLGDPSRQYDVATLYCRLIPAQMGFANVPDGDAAEVQIWKFVVVNGQYLVLAEPKDNVHNLLPLLICQPEDDGLGLQGISNAQVICGYQQLAKELMDRQLAAMDRNIEDRTIYDPRYLDQSDLDAKLPAANIPLTTKAQTDNIKSSEASYQVPFRDTSTPVISSTLAMVQGLARERGSNNMAQQGQFVKGNKTKSEFDRTMQGADAPMLLRAIAIDATLYKPIKLIVKWNILQYGASAEEGAEVNPQSLIDQQAEFKLAGGLEPLAIALASGELEWLLNILATSPMFGAQYDVGGVLSDLSASKGLELSKYKLTAEQQAQQNAVPQQPPEGGA